MKKIKKWFEKHGGKALIGTIAFLIVGIVAFIVGAYMTGWDIFAWFITPNALFVYAFIVLALFIVIMLWYWAKKGKYNNE
ncbi:MAG TPA: hypothetical protein PLR16_07135 [Bacilli bacterium]|nr:hypothetical protein [Bacilli bacterium]